MENKEKNAPAYIQGLGDVAEKLQKRYDFGKAIREAAQGRLTGLEAEMNQEARTEFTGSKKEQKLVHKFTVTNSNCTLL